MLRNSTPKLWQHMEEVGLTLSDFFNESTRQLSESLGFDASGKFGDNERREALFAADKELEFMGHHHIRGVFMGDERYPWRLLDTEEPPMLLYVLGECDLNREHSVSVVGTRRPTAYGVETTRRLVKELSEYFPDLCVVSGLAYGIDVTAHMAALEAERETIAVVAHGLQMIYPAAHRDIAGRIVKSGGAIVSEYPSGSTPYRNRFLERNRIVACMSAALIVAESDLRGGAMSTAHDAFSYSRDVFAIPGRVGDDQSRGTNHLIRKHKAELLTCSADLIENLGWKPAGVRVESRQRNLFPELDGEQRQIYDILRMESDSMTLDRLHSQTGLPVAQLMAALSEMEFEGIVCRQPGNRFGVIG